MDVLPGMIAPGANAVSFEPATHRAGRDGRKRWVVGQVLGHFGSTPAGQRRSGGTRQATSGGGNLGTHLRGKNASAPLNGARRPACGWSPSVCATCAPADHWCPPAPQSVGCCSQDAQTLAK